MQARVQFDGGAEKVNAWLWPWTTAQLVDEGRTFKNMAQYVACRECVTRGNFERAEQLLNGKTDAMFAEVEQASERVLEDAVYLLLQTDRKTLVLLRETREIPIASSRLPRLAEVWSTVRNEVKDLNMSR